MHEFALHCNRKLFESVVSILYFFQHILTNSDCSVQDIPYLTMLLHIYKTQSINLENFSSIYAILIPEFIQQCFIDITITKILGDLSFIFIPKESS